MRSFWKIAVPVSCVAVICGAAITWQIYRAKANELKLAEDARLCRVSAEQGDANAQANLGYMYFHGQGVPQDYGEALRLYRKATDQGCAKAQFNLGSAYFHGQGVPQDYGEALRWYRKAADQGDAMAQDALGLMYYHGEGVPQDRAEAVRRYRKAADQGYAKAQYNLGYMYYYGRGVPQDYAEAVRWYRKAADQGDEYALRALSAELTISRGFVLLVQFLGSIWLLDLFSFNSLVPGKSLRDFRQRLITGTGVLGVFSAGLSLYGYTHYKIRCLNCGFAAFTLFRWLLNAVWIALLVYIMRSGKKSGVQQDGIDSSDAATGSEMG